MARTIVNLLILCIILVSSVNARKYRITSQIYMEVQHGEKYIGKMIIGLFGDYAPKTVENFRQICINGIDGKTYVGSKFHRVIDRFIIQGGDIVNGDGSGSISIYGEYFDDEYLELNHSGSGFIAMANRGPNTNGCQFYITTMPAPWLDGKHTIFGMVLEGYGFIHVIEKVKTNTDNYPSVPVTIIGCGDVPTPEPFDDSDDPYDLWGWIRATAVPLTMSFSILALFQWINHKLP